MRKCLLGMVVLVVLSLFPADIHAWPANSPPSVELRISGGTSGLSLPVQIFLLLSVLTFLPAILMSMTSFARILVIMHFLRQSIGLQGVPSNQILIGLSLILTLFIMQPVGERINERALQPLMDGKIGYQEAFNGAIVPLREFMLKQTREKDIVLFLEIAKQPRPKVPADLSTQVLAPAFMISELKTAFQIGFLMFLPFLIIDLVVSSILLAMGMMQLPPIVISTPFKILLFVMVDGWNLVIASVVKSFM
jgi:flagellar biosynthesis protein FliP